MITYSDPRVTYSDLQWPKGDLYWPNTPPLTSTYLNWSLISLIRAETMVCFTAFSLKADQMTIFGLLLVFFLLKSLHFMNFPKNDDWYDTQIIMDL